MAENTQTPTAERTVRPVPAAQLPAGAVCALAPGGRLSEEDVWHVRRFREYLRRRKQIQDEYEQKAAGLGQGSPERARLRGECDAELRTLRLDYEADTPHSTTAAGTADQERAEQDGTLP